jgi:molecular chaperone GrpE (heat shock protein)
MTRLNQFVESLREFIGARLVLPRLLTPSEREKLKTYRLLASKVSSLNLALNTQQRALDEVHRQLDARDKLVNQLRADQELALRRLEEAATSAVDATIFDIYRRLEPIAIQLPTLRSSVDAASTLTIADVFAIFAPLDDMLKDMGLATIGDIDQEVPFNPRYHQLASDLLPLLSEGDKVRVRYVGYQYKGQVLRKADVSRIVQPQSVG